MILVGCLPFAATEPLTFNFSPWFYDPVLALFCLFFFPPLLMHSGHVSFGSLELDFVFFCVTERPAFQVGLLFLKEPVQLSRVGFFHTRPWSMNAFPSAVFS